MGKKYLIDTNVLIEYLAQLFPERIESKVSDVLDSDFNISFINKIEVLGHVSASNDIVEFLNAARIFYIDNEIIAQTIGIRKTSKIKLPDAILAATAITYDLVLLTRNVSDFKGLDNLRLENPWDWAS
jgi:predicted nucleic acid-binding protein